MVRNKEILVNKSCCLAKAIALIGETNFLGQDREQEIRLTKTYYETETEK